MRLLHKARSLSAGSAVSVRSAPYYRFRSTRAARCVTGAPPVETRAVEGGRRLSAAAAPSDIDVGERVAQQSDEADVEADINLRALGSAVWKRCRPDQAELEGLPEGMQDMVSSLCKQAHHEKDIQTLSPKLCRFARKKQASLQVCVTRKGAYAPLAIEQCAGIVPVYGGRMLSISPTGQSRSIGPSQFRGCGADVLTSHYRSTGSAHGSAAGGTPGSRWRASWSKVGKTVGSHSLSTAVCSYKRSSERCGRLVS